MAPSVLFSERLSFFLVLFTSYFTHHAEFTTKAWSMEKEPNDSSKQPHLDHNHVPRASDTRKRLYCNWMTSSSTSTTTTISPAGLDVECTMRSIAYDMAMQVPTARRHFGTILESLKASECPNTTFRFPPNESQIMYSRDDATTRSKNKKNETDETVVHDDSWCGRQQHTLFVDCTHGNDSSVGTCEDFPLKSLHRAQQRIQQMRMSTNNHKTPNGSNAVVTIYLREGICFLNQTTLYLTQSNTVWKAYPGERPVVSGGALLTRLKWVPYTKNIVVADLPPSHLVNASAVDGLFTFLRSTSKADDDSYDIISSQIRLTRARYPNGNSEQDRMPTNYDKLHGSVSSIHAWTAAGNVSVRFPGIEKQKNASSFFYPWFGHSRDVRWVQDYHLENSSSYYGTHTQFWQPIIATAASYQYQPKSSRRLVGNNTHTHHLVSSKAPSVTAWGSSKNGAVIHIIHYNWWGNWQWEVIGQHLGNVNSSIFNNFEGKEEKIGRGSFSHHPKVILEFGKGGWQDAHGGAVSHNYFFIENVMEELDMPGEFYMDKSNRKLYYWPLSSQSDNLHEWEFVVTQLPVIVQIGSTANQLKNISRSRSLSPVRNIVVEGIAFAHTTTTFLEERYTVPSAGDWSVLPKGAVTLRRAVNVTLDRCSWLQVNGNGVALHGMVHNSSIIRADFVKVGDSGIVSVGRLPKSRPYKGYGVETVPADITIRHCHFGQTGVYGKQTSALFIALSKRIHFVDNVLYDGPRAGININDGFGGGHYIARNVIFNQVLESGDHGPINTWSRSAYTQQSEDDPNVETVIPAWNHIDQNFVMLGPKYGALYGPGDGPCSNGDPKFYCPKNGGSLYLCLDHDDGSEYYLDTRNVCAFAGLKNYIGQNKIWDSNLLVFPEGAVSQNRSGSACIWTSMDMAGDPNTLPCSNKPCRTREVYTNNSCLTSHNMPLEYDMFNETDLGLHGIRNTTIPYTARNQYFLPSPYNFHGKWNLSEAQAHGVDEGSREYRLDGMVMKNLDGMARSLLDLPVFHPVDVFKSLPE